jgi:hypothetical protein
VKPVHLVWPDSPDETVFQVLTVPKVPKGFGENQVATEPLVQPALTVNQVFQVCLALTVSQVEPVFQAKARSHWQMLKCCWLLPKVHPVHKVCQANEVNAVLEVNKVQPVFEVKTAAQACQVFSAKTALQV